MVKGWRFAEVFKHVLNDLGVGKDTLLLGAVGAVGVWLFTTLFILAFN